MPKAKMTTQDWRNEPATDYQIMRLLVLLKISEVIEPEPGDELEEFEGEAVDWANEYLAREIVLLRELTKGEMGMLFGKLE